MVVRMVVVSGCIEIKVEPSISISTTRFAHSSLTVMPKNVGLAVPLEFLYISNLDIDLEWICIMLE